MTIRGVVRDADGSSELAHREIEASALGEELQRCIEERAAQVSMVIVGARGHVEDDSRRRPCGQAPHCDCAPPRESAM